MDENAKLLDDMLNRKYFISDYEELETMPFGQFKGERFHNIPTYYLVWVHTHAYQENARKASAKELIRRRTVELNHPAVGEVVPPVYEP